LQAVVRVASSRATSLAGRRGGSLALDQHAAQDLARGRLWDLLDKLDDADAARDIDALRRRWRQTLSAP
jgi:hypothetical protein